MKRRSEDLPVFKEYPEEFPMDFLAEMYGVDMNVVPLSALEEVLLIAQF